MGEVFDLSAAAFTDDPAALAARMRAQGAVVRARLPIVGEVWLAVTQAAAEQVLGDAATFSMRRPDGGLAAGPRWLPAVLGTLTASMITLDEPDHSRLRRLVDEAFRRRAVQDMAPRVRVLADRFADRLFAEGAPADLLERYARLLPVAVIADLLGLPEADHPRFLAFARPLLDITGVLDLALALPRLWGMRRYLRAQVAAARAHGGTGLIGELVRVRHDRGALTGDERGALSEDELVGMVFLLLTAGFETTTHLIAGAVHELLVRPERIAWLVEEPARFDLAVEEMLRFVSPVQATKPRYVNRDVDVGGVQLRAGDRIMVLLASCNRDPARFEAPDALDLSRRPNRHVSFGHGIHFCLGHQLARLEGRIALEALFARHPGLRLAVPAGAIRWRRRPGLRALAALPVAPG